MRRTARQTIASGFLIGLVGCALGSTCMAAQVGVTAPASIRGQVADVDGQPLPGALVAVRSPSLSLGEQFVLTDRLGMFDVAGLSAGEYLVTVTKSAFLPVVLSSVELLPGVQEVVAVNLQTTMDFVRRGVRRGNVEDMKWALRSAQSTRPILRHNGTLGNQDSPAGPEGSSMPSGYVQVYSTSMGAEKGALDTVGSQFAVTVPVSGDSRVRVEGQYSESQNQPRGIGATYEFSREGKQSSFGVNVRQGAHFTGSAPGASQREVALEYVEQVQWSDDLVFHYGAAVGRTEGSSDRNYMRPEFGATWVVRPRTTVRAVFSRRDPTDSHDPVRGHEYFDRAVYIPPELERFSHMELGITQLLASGIQISAGAFRDGLGTQAFMIDAEDGRRGFLIVDGSAMPTTGVRFVVDRDFDGFEASVGYTYASAFGFDPDVESPDDLRVAATRRGFHVLTARVSGIIDLTQTELTAVYRWAPGFSLMPVDPYQLYAEYNDPTLSLTVAQNLPSGGLFPAQLQAVVDARNLFEPSFGSRRTIHASHPRILRGGIHFKF